MIVDLVSPWLAAIEATDPARARAAFRNRHAGVLEALRVARTPDVDVLPLATDPNQLHAIVRRVADPATQQLLRDVLARAAGLGADHCESVILLAGADTGDGATAQAVPVPAAILFVEQLDDDQSLVVALARALVVLTRGGTPGLRGDRTVPPQWDAARRLPLREWIYLDGMGTHLAAALLPDAPANQLFGLNQSAFNRLREREKVFRALLDADLDGRGVGLVLRWLTPRAPVGPRTIGDVVLPPMAGRYLAWRLTAERVGRVGLREAIRANA